MFSLKRATQKLSRVLLLPRSSVTLYGTGNKLLIPKDLKIYDRTTFCSESNEDGMTTITLSPIGAGKNGIPTYKDFYGILRANLPAPGAIMKVEVRKQ